MPKPATSGWWVLPGAAAGVAAGVVALEVSRLMVRVSLCLGDLRIIVEKPLGAYNLTFVNINCFYRSRKRRQSPT